MLDVVAAAERGCWGGGCCAALRYNVQETRKIKEAGLPKEQEQAVLQQLLHKETKLLQVRSEGGARRRQSMGDSPGWGQAHWAAEGPAQPAR